MSHYLETMPLIILPRHRRLVLEAFAKKLRTEAEVNPCGAYSYGIRDGLIKAAELAEAEAKRLIRRKPKD